MKELDRPIRVLLLENDPEKIFLIKELLKGIGTDFAVSVANGGRNAMEILNRSVGKDTVPFALVIMDSVRSEIEMSEIMTYMRSMHGLQKIPVVVMAKSPTRIEEMMKRSGGTAHCIIRPSSHAEFQAMQALVRTILDRPPTDA
jgi:CheY-like chemotaxis protein